MITVTIISFACLGLAIGLLTATYINNNLKRSYYLNVYEFPNGELYSDKVFCKTKREAIFDSAGRTDYVRTIKIKL